MESPRLRALTKSPQAATSIQENIERGKLDNHAHLVAYLQPGIIGSLFDALMVCLHDVLRELRQQDIRRQTYLHLEKHAAALLFWGSDHDVGFGTLDRTLQHSGYLRDTVLLILISIGETISQGFLRGGLNEATSTRILGRSSIASLLKKARLTVEEAEENEGLPETAQELDIDEGALCIVLGGYIQSLGLLNSSLGLPTRFEDQEKHGTVPTRTQTHEPYQYFVEMAAARFPSADSELVQVLGHSNWERYKHVQRQRHASKTEAYTITKHAKSESHGSELETTLPAVPDTYAAKALSSRVEVGHKGLPSLSKQAKLGEPFPCCICNQEVVIRTTGAWKRHIFKDIYAYSCVYKKCPSPGMLFQEPKALSAHLRSHHQFYRRDQERICPLCLERLADNESQSLFHLQQHLEQMALLVIPPCIDSDHSCFEKSISEASGNYVRDARVFPPLPLRSAQPLLYNNVRGLAKGASTKRPRQEKISWHDTQNEITSRADLKDPNQSVLTTNAKHGRSGGHDEHKVVTSFSGLAPTNQDVQEKARKREKEDKIFVARADRQAQVELEAQGRRDLVVPTQQVEHQERRGPSTRHLQEVPLQVADNASRQPYLFDSPPSLSAPSFGYPGIEPSSRTYSSAQLPYAMFGTVVPPPQQPSYELHQLQRTQIMPTITNWPRYQADHESMSTPSSCYPGVEPGTTPYSSIPHPDATFWASGYSHQQQLFEPLRLQRSEDPPAATYWPRAQADHDCDLHRNSYTGQCTICFPYG